MKLFNSLLIISIVGNASAFSIDFMQTVNVEKETLITDLNNIKSAVNHYLSNEPTSLFSDTSLFFEIDDWLTTLQNNDYLDSVPVYGERKNIYWKYNTEYNFYYLNHLSDSLCEQINNQHNSADFKGPDDFLQSLTDNNIQETCFSYYMDDINHTMNMLFIK
jgi:hypothetical protein